MLIFVHEHHDPPAHVTLNVRLCASCGNRIEKHLKRAIPKRLMVIRSTDAPVPQPDAREAVIPPVISP